MRFYTETHKHYCGIDLRTSYMQRMQKDLTLMNLQLHNVISNITRGTGMAILPDVQIEARLRTLEATVEAPRPALPRPRGPRRPRRAPEVTRTSIFAPPSFGSAGASISP